MAKSKAVWTWKLFQRFCEENGLRDPVYNDGADPRCNTRRRKDGYGEDHIWPPLGDSVERLGVTVSRNSSFGCGNVVRKLVDEMHCEVSQQGGNEANLWVPTTKVMAVAKFLKCTKAGA